MRLVEDVRGARQRRDHAALRRANGRQLILRGRAGGGASEGELGIVRAGGSLGAELEEEAVAALRRYAQAA